MKRIIILVVVAALSVVFTVDWASARGNHRSAIDRQWKKVQAWQMKQDREFKAIQRESERMLKEMDGPKGSRPVMPSNGYQRQCP